MNKSTVDTLFEELRQYAEADARRWGLISASFLWRVKEEGKIHSWIHRFGSNIEMRKLASSESAPADCSISISAVALSQLVDGEFSLQQAFLTAEMQIAGDMRCAFRLQHMFELWQESRSTFAQNSELQNRHISALPH